MFHPIDDFCIEGTACSVTGTAIFDITADHFMDADVGGFDGFGVIAELIELRLDGVALSREQCVQISGKSSIGSFEAQVAEQMYIELGEAA